MDIFSNIKLYSQIGLRMHAYCSSLGKRLLANYSNTQLRSIMGRTEFTRFTPNTITTIEALQKEIDSVRQRGWAIDNEEFEIGHRRKTAFIKKALADFIRKRLSEFL